jgi:hypothetical protein
MTFDQWHTNNPPIEPDRNHTHPGLGDIHCLDLDHCPSYCDHTTEECDALQEEPPEDPNFGWELPDRSGEEEMLGRPLFPNEY